MVWKMPEGEKKLYLTFDDGPHPEITLEVLHHLRKRDVKATFFCIGKNVVQHSAVIAAIEADGHTLGNHSFDHLNGWRVKEDKVYLDDVEKCANYIDSPLFRPPYGRVKNRVVKTLVKKYKVIMWSQLSADFDQSISPEECLKNSLKSKDGDIVIFHDSEKAKKNMLYALPLFLDYYLEKGFTFEPL